MRFKIDLKIFIFIILFYFTKQIETYAMIMIFAIIHEFGHLFMGLILGMKPDKLEIKPYGIAISFKLTPKDYNKKVKNGNLLEIKKIVVAIAGPLSNLLIILIASNLNLSIFTELMVVYSNLLLIIFNLLPIYPLDGGRILKAILHIIFGKQKSEKYINNISFIFIMILTLIGSISIYVLQNISIFLIIIFLWCIFIQQDLIYKRRIKIYNLMKKSLEIK